MTKDNQPDTGERKPLTLRTEGKLGLRSPGSGGPSKVQQQFSHGRVKTVLVETKRRRSSGGKSNRSGDGLAGDGKLTDQEMSARVRAVRQAIQQEDNRNDGAVAPVATGQAFPVVVIDPNQAREKEVAAIAKAKLQSAEAVDVSPAPAASADEPSSDQPTESATPSAAAAKARVAPAPREREKPFSATTEETEKVAPRRHGAGARPAVPKAPGTRWRDEQRRRAGKLTVSQALDGDDKSERTRSLASVRRARERARRGGARQTEQGKIIRDVIVPEMITVGELANRMAERTAEVIKQLMKIGVMATITQTIDADTAELVANELGHRVKRVAEADIVADLGGEKDDDADLQPRPPVITIMGHVDHGKTSLLDALRNSSVAAGEAGGITQHIGAYQVTTKDGKRITFFDTPGHEAFSKMRSRGANLTDVVVLVVASDDGVMPQTIEAINHAKAAAVPLIVAINKCDLPGATPDRVRNELLRHEVVVEKMGGETLDVEISARNGTNLDKLVEAILLQAELHEPRANPNRSASGVVVESRLDRGRGALATVLIRNGTLHIGDVFVAGSEWGRVRAMLNEHGERMDEAGPGVPVEVLGLQGTPQAGDDFVVVEGENRARDVAAYRKRLSRAAIADSVRGGSVEQMFARLREEDKVELPVIVKADAQGSAEAIAGSFDRLADGDITIRVLHSGVGAINETDVSLATASKGIIIGFNVRAIPQARMLAKRDGVDIRYYSTIYRVVEELATMLSDMKEPEIEEKVVGNAEIREVFEIGKIGRIAGCYVAQGVVRRSAPVRLLRDSMVIYDGKLRSLRRFSDEAREVANGLECGLTLENFQDLRQGDVVECYERV